MTLSPREVRRAEMLVEILNVWRAIGRADTVTPEEARSVLQALDTLAGEAQCPSATGGGRYRCLREQAHLGQHQHHLTRWWDDGEFYEPADGTVIRRLYRDGSWTEDNGLGQRTRKSFDP